MIQRNSTWITVIDVMREMGIQPEKKLDWKVGLLMAQWYIKLTDEQPEKQNREKTFTEGVHCFAIYPQCFRKKIKEFILMCQFEQDYQSKFPFMGEE